MKPLLHATLAWVAILLSIPAVLWVVLAIHDGIHDGLFPCILLAITFLAISWSHFWAAVEARATSDESPPDEYRLLKEGEGRFPGDEVYDIATDEWVEWGEYHDAYQYTNSAPCRRPLA